MTPPQAQQGVQRKQFSALDDLVEYYSQPKRGLVCGLTTPISPSREEEPQEPDEESGDLTLTHTHTCQFFLTLSFCPLYTLAIIFGISCHLSLLLTVCDT